MVKDDKINYLNIGLMLVTMALAYYFPFETFLFAYAFLGPLHYLTEISWLHDRQYFTKGKYDFIPLLLMAEPKSSFLPDSINLAFSFVIKSSLSNANCTISA